jgi:hypothetical protein
MPIRCSVLEAEGVVELAYSGAVSPEELQAMLLAAIETGRRTSILRFLADLTGMSGGHSAGDLFAVVHAMEQLGVPRAMREAIVPRPGSIPDADARFFEDACRNRGFDVRIFPDRPSALAWLQDEGR